MNIINMGVDLSRKDRSFLNLALRVAESSECEHKHGAVVVKGGRVVGVGHNKMRSVNNPVGDNTVHAEVDAMRRCSDASLDGAVLYVARVDSLGMGVLSFPCPECQMWAYSAGIKRIVHT